MKLKKVNIAIDGKTSKGKHTEGGFVYSFMVPKTSKKIKELGLEARGIRSPLYASQLEFFWTLVEEMEKRHPELEIEVTPPQARGQGWNWKILDKTPKTPKTQDTKQASK